MHIYALAHVLRRPLVVYADEWARDAAGARAGRSSIAGVYLPDLWEEAARQSGKAAGSKRNARRGARLALAGGRVSPPRRSSTNTSLAPQLAQ